MKVNPGLRNSYEEYFHSIGNGDDFILIFNDDVRQLKDFTKQKIERAIGVIYRPMTERISHYFSADIANQFDAVIHIDNTSALEPLDKTEHWVEEELPETYPSGL